MAAEPLAGFGAQFRFERRYGGDTRRRRRGGGGVDVRKHVGRGAMGSSDIREPVCRLGPDAPAAAAIVVGRRLGQRGRRLLAMCWLVIAPPPNDDPTPSQSAAARQPRSRGLADRLFAITKVAPFVVIVIVVFSAK